MTTRDDDRDLRERFASLRREEEPQATPLHRLIETAASGRMPRRRGALAPALAVVAVLAALGLIIGQALPPDRPAEPGKPLVSLAAWTEPTAFLLRTPGGDILSTVPEFGRDLPEMKRSPSP